MDGKQILDNIKDVKNADKDKLLLDYSAGNMTTTIIGGGLGFLIAYNHKYNLLMGTIIGGAVAGIVGNFFINKR